MSNKSLIHFGIFPSASVLAQMDSPRLHRMSLGEAGCKWVCWLCKCFFPLSSLCTLYLHICCTFFHPYVYVFIAAVAQKEEENFQQWREANRVRSVHVTPERLGKSTHLLTQHEFTQCKSCWTVYHHCFITHNLTWITPI